MVESRLGADKHQQPQEESKQNPVVFRSLSQGGQSRTKTQEEQKISQQKQKVDSKNQQLK